jgi:hypothetical protein
LRGVGRTICSDSIIIISSKGTHNKNLNISLPLPNPRWQPHRSLKFKSSPITSKLRAKIMELYIPIKLTFLKVLAPVAVVAAHLWLAVEEKVQVFRERNN